MPKSDNDSSRSNETDDRFRSPSPDSGGRLPPYFVPRRPRVVKMRDLSPETRSRLTREYYDAYDPWVGIRIAATLGILISMFTLFLIYKSKFNKSKSSLLPSKKTALYLYDDDVDDCDLDSMGSSEHSTSYGYSYPYGKNNVDDRMMFPYQEGFQLEEVYVKNQVVECVALKVHRPGRKSSKSGPKLGTLNIADDASKSLPCSPYKPDQPETDVKAPHSPTYSTGPTSLTGSIASFGSGNSVASGQKQVKGTGKASKDSENKGLKKLKRAATIEKDSNPCPKSLVVTAKKPQDYRSRSTVVAIARRKKPS